MAQSVLILVLMEDTLRGITTILTNWRTEVLILVLMEDTLRVRVSLSVDKAIRGVLILVLMEDTLRVLLHKKMVLTKSLNPCFNGRYSQSVSRRVSSMKLER